MLRLGIIMFLVALGGCASMRLQQMQEAKNNAITGAMQCETQTWSTRADQARCESAAIRDAYSQANYPYMDLVEAMAAQNILIAQQLDGGKITMQQAVAMTTAMLDRMQQQEAQRESLSTRQRQAVAAAFMNFGRSMQNAYTPSPATNCTTTYTGSVAFTNCH